MVQEFGTKYKYDELLTFLEKEAKEKGDTTRGHVVYEKGLCIKCHKYGDIGEGVGPDLSTLSKRFKRADILEALYYPSKVISDCIALRRSSPWMASAMTGFSPRMVALTRWFSRMPPK